MKSLIITLTISLISFAANAQQTSLPDSTEKRTFIGIGLSSTAYQVMGKPKYRIVTGVIPFATLHYGYKLSKRATIQAGIGYGGNESVGYSLRYISPDSVYDEKYTQIVRALVLPITFKFTPFDIRKRLQLYGNASITPVIGHVKAKAEETFEGSTNILYDEKMPSVTVIATAGLTLNYKLSKRIDIYADGNLLYHNFRFKRANRRWLDDASAGIGINYRL